MKRQILLEGPGSEMVDPNMQICPNYGVQRYCILPFSAHLFVQYPCEKKCTAFHGRVETKLVGVISGWRAEWG